MRIRSTARQQGELREVFGTCFFVLFVEQVIDSGAMQHRSNNDRRNEEVEIVDYDWTVESASEVGRSHASVSATSVLRKRNMKLRTE